MSYGAATHRKGVQGHLPQVVRHGGYDAIFSFVMRYVRSQSIPRCNAPLQGRCISSILRPLTTHVILASIGDVAELADAHDLGSCAARRAGSTPAVPTMLGCTRLQRQVRIETRRPHQNAPGVEAG